MPPGVTGPARSSKLLAGTPGRSWTARGRSDPTAGSGEHHGLADGRFRVRALAAEGAGFLRRAIAFALTALPGPTSPSATTGSLIWARATGVLSGRPCGESASGCLLGKDDLLELVA